MTREKAGLNRLRLRGMYTWPCKADLSAGFQRGDGRRIQVLVPSSFDCMSPRRSYRIQALQIAAKACQSVSESDARWLQITAKASHACAPQQDWSRSCSALDPSYTKKDRRYSSSPHLQQMQSSGRLRSRRGSSLDDFSHSA